MSDGTEVASAYVALRAKFPGIKKDIEEALGVPLKEQAEKSGPTMGEKLMDGLKSAGKVGAIAVGGAIAAGVGTAMVKGFQRLDALDQAESKLRGLGHSASTVDEIMNNALASVKGTAFGLGEAATTAAGAVAAGIKPGTDLERTLKAVADAAAIAGVDMGSMGAIFNKVAASNKVQMDVINQLHDAGVPALALLADQMGVTAEEASKMASKGEIDFATFRAAMEAGMGGAALESGNTFSGAMDNVMAALGRVGANLLGGIFPQMTDGFKGVIEWLGPFEDGAKEVGKAIGAFVADAGPKLVSVLGQVWEVGQNVVGWIKDNLTWLGPLVVAIAAGAAAWTAMSTAISIWQGIVKAATAVQLAFNLVMNANPIMLIVTAIAALVAGLVYFFTQTELGRQIWENVTNAIGAAVTWLWESVLQPVFGFIGAIFTWLYESIIQPVGAFIVGAITTIGEIFTWLYENIIYPVVFAIMLYIGLWAALFVWLYETIVQPIFNLIGAAFTWIWESIIQPIIDYIQLAIWAWGVVFEWLYTNIVKPVFDGIAAVFQWIWDSIIQPIIGYVELAIKGWGIIFEWLHKNVIKPVFDAVGAAFKWVWESVIKPVSDFISGAIKTVGDTIHNVFSGIADFIGAAFQSVLNVVRGPINALIDLINGIIGGLNSIKVDIPDWVPMVGGQTFGLNIPKIPRLAEGAWVEATRGGTLAVVGEGKHDEAVIPLGGSQFEALAEALADQMGDRETVSSDPSDAFIDKLARAIAKYSRTEARMGVA